MPSPLTQLTEELRRLHRSAGEPSTREIAKKTAGAISHTTANRVLRSGLLPKWGPLEMVVEALGGDAGRFIELWVSARDSLDDKSPKEPQPAPVSNLPGARTEPESTDVDPEGPIGSGLKTLDGLLGGGFRPGQLIVVGGEPAVGKSMLALGFASTASFDKKVPALFLTLESNQQDTLFRILSAEARVQLHLLRSAQLNDDEWTRVAAAAGSISEAPLFLADTCEDSLEAVLAEIESAVVRHGVRLVVVDYLQQIQAACGVSDMEHSVRSLRAFKRLATRLRLPIIAVAQIRGMPRTLRSKFVRYLELPDLSAFMEETDTLLLLHQDALNDPYTPRLGEADLIVAKNRNGPTAIVNLAAQVHLSRFVDIGILE